MKTSVRFLSLLLAIIMIAGAALTASADVAEEKANSAALQLLVDLGIFGGYDDGSLQPDKLVERDEMAKIIFVLYTTFTDAGAGVVSFKDVAENDWAAGYISWCSSKGIIGGFGDGTFRPNDNVTYDQALKMVCGALGYTDWDSAFWPVDVRTKALVDLKLGEDIPETVKGTDKVTRAQIAQIVYNSLFQKMNETKEVVVEVGNSRYPVVTQAAKVLATDVWGFGKSDPFRITAVKGFGYATVSEDKDISVDQLGEFTLEELGLEAYEKNIADLFNADLSFFYDSKKVTNIATITSENILAASITENATKGVEVTYDAKKNEIYVGEEKIEDTPYLIKCSDSGVVTKASFTVSDVPAEDILYEAVGYDFDADNRYDEVYIEYPSAYKVTSATTKQVSFKEYTTATSLTKKVEDIDAAVELKEDDVVVAVNNYGTFVVKEVVAPVTGRAAEYVSSKITLEDGTTFAINKKFFENVSATNISASVMNLTNGVATEYDYYAYDGKVFYTDATNNKVDVKFAVLSYIDDPTPPKFNEETKTEDVFYNAVITIDGKEQTVPVNADNTIDGRGVKTDATLLDEFGKLYTNNGKDILARGTMGKYVYNHAKLVTYTVDDNGNYSFATTVTDPEIKTESNAVKLQQNKETKLYELVAADGTVLVPKVLLTDAKLYYTYTKDATGEYKYLGEYTESDLPADFASVELIGNVYYTKEADSKFSTLLVATIDKENMKTGDVATTDYKTDARHIFYCYQTSTEALGPDGRSAINTYYFKNIHGGVNTSFENPDAETVAARKGYYAWDEEKDDYVKVTKNDRIARFDIEDISGNVIFTKQAKYADGVYIPDDAIIWGVVVNSYGNYRTYTMSTLTEMVKLVQDYNESAGKSNNLPVIIGTHLDENGKEVVNTVIVKPYEVVDGVLQVQDNGELRYCTANAGWDGIDIWTPES